LTTILPGITVPQSGREPSLPVPNKAKNAARHESFLLGKEAAS
jgi:hypothetical protein